MQDKLNSEQLDRHLLAAVNNFVQRHNSSFVEKFKPGLRDWGDAWTGVGEAYLPAAGFLTSALTTTHPETHDLLTLFEQHRHRLLWEQSYRKTDGVVSDALLDGYGFAEIVGSRGPLVSNRIRCGIGVWGPDIVYPHHRHKAEEIYILLAGSAEYSVADEKKCYRAGDVVFVESMAVHGFRTTTETLVVCYLWQTGDLREISSFV